MALVVGHKSIQVHRIKVRGCIYDDEPPPIPLQLDCWLEKWREIEGVRHRKVVPKFDIVSDEYSPFSLCVCLICAVSAIQVLEK